MKSPYRGQFKITQAQHSEHGGLDLVGLQDKSVYAIADGTVTHAGWENSNNRQQGFGLYCSIQSDNGERIYYGHLSACNVAEGQRVTKGDLLGIEGNTGHSTGSHLHIECRVNGNRNQRKNIFDILGIPNVRGAIIDVVQQPVSANTHTVVSGDTLSAIAKRFGCTVLDLTLINGITNPNLINIGQVIKLPSKSTAPVNPHPEPTRNISRGARGEDVKWVQWALSQKGYNIGSAGVDGICGNDTLSAIKKFQSENGLDVDGIVGKLTRAKLR